MAHSLQLLKCKCSHSSWMSNSLTVIQAKWSTLMCHLKYIIVGFPGSLKCVQHNLVVRVWIWPRIFCNPNFKQKPLKKDKIVIAFSSGLRSQNVVLSNLASFKCKLKHIFKGTNLGKVLVNRISCFIVDTVMEPCQASHTSEFVLL